MSASYYAYLLYGCHVEMSSSKPNPRYGKHRFDPDTGELVERFIVTSLRDDLDELINAQPDGMRVNYQDSTDARETILGVPLATITVGGGCDDDTPGFDPLTPAQMEAAQERIIGMLRQLKACKGDEAFRYHLVGYCSY